MSLVSCVIFDLGKVLVDWDLSRGLWTGLKHYFGSPDNRTETGLKWERLYNRYARGKIAPGDFHLELMQLIGLKLSYDDFVKHWCDIFQPMDDMDLLLGEVAERVPVGLLSDTDPLHWAYLLESYPWLEIIEKPTLSFQTGVLKPDPQAYLTASSNMGFASQDCFFTDDLERNIQGALNTGMDAVQFGGSKALRQELTKRGVFKA